jgi:L-lactate dehydrogenase complex protein LldG
MSTARASILAALRANRPPGAGPPRRVAAPPMPPEPLTVLQERVEQAGGRLQRAERQRLVESIAWPMDLDTVAHLYSTLPALPGRGVGRTAREPGELAALELCVVRGEFAVVENGAVWQVPGSLLERAAVLLAEHLVVVIEAEACVASLHDAYTRIDLGNTGFGWLLCGPSKTADIEQALVLGAHGACTMQLVLAED